MSLDDLIGGPNRYGRPTTARAKVDRAPTSFTDGLAAVLVNYSALSPFEVPRGQWTVRAGGGLPVRGDLALLIFDDEGDCWAQVASTAPA